MGYAVQVPIASNGGVIVGSYTGQLAEHDKFRLECTIRFPFAKLVDVARWKSILMF